jgi:hypothetical protein
MKVIDARRNPARAAWRVWRRRLQGVVMRTLASAAPREAWSASLPALAAAAEAARRAQLAHEHHRRGRDMDAAAYDSVRAERSKIEPVIAAIMGPRRCVQILGIAGVDLERAMRLLELVGPSVSEALAFTDVVDVMLLDDDRRGAA